MKKRIGIVVIMLLIPAMLIGCKPKVAADESAKILADFAIKNNSSEISKLGDTKSDIYLSMEKQKNEFKKGFKESFEKSSGMTIDDEKVDEFYKAYVNAMKKITITTNKISENGKTAKVNVKVTYIDLKSIVFAGVNKMLDLENSGKGESELVDDYMDNIVKGLKDAKPSTKTKEATFNFIIKDNIWIPEDAHGYFKKISDLSLGDLETELNKLKIDPDKSATMLFNFYIKGDRTGSAKEFAELTGKDYSDKIEKMRQEAFKNSFRSTFTEQGMTISDDDCNKIYSAYQNAIKSITATSTKLSQSGNAPGNTAVVSVKANYIDIAGVSKTAGSEAVSDIKAMGLTDEGQAKSEFVKSFVNHLQKDLNAAKPGTETKEKTFTFVLKGFMWMPVDSRDFGNQIESMISGQ
ncbi:DUF5105 domain-containing protein [Clostridium neuense]|uniref:DUF5105 domain-containing protein n=1 Tax=Clostridium neuense TaxID=1728934 RepID=A0ABW8THY0_9CLOT